MQSEFYFLFGERAASPGIVFVFPPSVPKWHLILLFFPLYQHSYHTQENQDPRGFGAWELVFRDIKSTSLRLVPAWGSFWKHCELRFFVFQANSPFTELFQVSLKSICMSTRSVFQSIILSVPLCGSLSLSQVPVSLSEFLSMLLYFLSFVWLMMEGFKTNKNKIPFCRIILLDQLRWSWLLSFILLRWHIRLIEFCLLTHSQIPRVDPTWS